MVAAILLNDSFDLTQTFGANHLHFLRQGTSSPFILTDEVTILVAYTVFYGMGYEWQGFGI